MILRPIRLLLALFVIILGAAGLFFLYGRETAPPAASLPLPSTFTPTPLPSAEEPATSTPVHIVAKPPTATPAPPSPPPSATPTSTSVAPTATPLPTPNLTISADLVNLRTGPGINYPIATRVQKGESFDIIARSDDDPVWYEVCCVGESETAWVRSDLVESNTTSAEITLAQHSHAATAPDICSCRRPRCPCRLGTASGSRFYRATTATPGRERPSRQSLHRYSRRSSQPSPCFCLHQQHQHRPSLPIRAQSGRFSLRICHGRARCNTLYGSVLERGCASNWANSFRAPDQCAATGALSGCPSLFGSQR
ncbi:MAG: SH3 domain-containing protein [Chloroflexi bacterium]|nr:SH3 domain-containing protein [Chloroflexota bacterium]